MYHHHQVGWGSSIVQTRELEVREFFVLGCACSSKVVNHCDFKKNLQAFSSCQRTWTITLVVRWPRLPFVKPLPRRDDDNEDDYVGRVNGSVGETGERTCEDFDVSLSNDLNIGESWMKWYWNALSSDTTTKEHALRGALHFFGSSKCNHTTFGLALPNEKDTWFEVAFRCKATWLQWTTWFRLVLSFDICKRKWTETSTLEKQTSIQSRFFLQLISQSQVDTFGSFPYYCCWLGHWFRWWRIKACLDVIMNRFQRSTPMIKKLWRQ